MLRVPHFQAVKEFIQRGLVGVIVLPDLATRIISMTMEKFRSSGGAW